MCADAKNMATPSVKNPPIQPKEKFLQATVLSHLICILFSHHITLSIRWEEVPPSNNPISSHLHLVFAPHHAFDLLLLHFICTWHLADLISSAQRSEGPTLHTCCPWVHPSKWSTKKCLMTQLQISNWISTMLDSNHKLDCLNHFTYQL
jgi:hypothetical protein